MHASKETHLSLFDDMSRNFNEGACVASLAGKSLVKLLLLIMTLARRNEVLKLLFGR